MKTAREKLNFLTSFISPETRRAYYEMKAFDRKAESATRYNNFINYKASRPRAKRLKKSRGKRRYK